MFCARMTSKGSTFFRVISRVDTQALTWPVVAALRLPCMNGLFLANSDACRMAIWVLPFNFVQPFGLLCYATRREPVWPCSHDPPCSALMCHVGYLK
jgi:hypothetical protein